MALYVCGAVQRRPCRNCTTKGESSTLVMVLPSTLDTSTKCQVFRFKGRYSEGLEGDQLASEGVGNIHHYAPTGRRPFNNDLISSWLEVVNVAYLAQVALVVDDHERLVTI